MTLLNQRPYRYRRPRPSGLGRLAEACQIYLVLCLLAVSAGLALYGLLQLVTVGS